MLERSVCILPEGWMHCEQEMVHKFTDRILYTYTYELPLACAQIGYHERAKPGESD
jgi:hypothetical protein